MATSKYCIGICELHNEIIHGFDDSSSSNIKGHYILMEKFSTYHEYLPNFYDTNVETDIDTDTDTDTDNSSTKNNIIDLYRYKYNILLKSVAFKNKKHEIIRNYHNIIKSINYIQPHIVECIYLPAPGEECVAILKTFWLKIIQRAWKRIYKQRTSLLKSLHYLRLREIGFEKNIYLPTIRGMLGNIYYKNKGV